MVKAAHNCQANLPRRSVEYLSKDGSLTGAPLPTSILRQIDQMEITFPSPNHSFAFAMTFKEGFRKYTASESFDRVQQT